MNYTKFTSTLSSFLLIFIFAFSFVPYNVLAEELDTTAPIVSIGSGNAAQQNIPAEGATIPLPNNPANASGPLHGSTISGTVPVYGTAYDVSNIYETHLRFIKEDTLLTPEQSTSCATFRSTTGVYDCGIFAYSQGMSAGFTQGLNSQQLLANVNTVEISQTQGNGWYWIMFGAQDVPGNYSNPDLEYWHRDPRIRVYIYNPLSLPVITIDDTYASPIDPGFVCGIGGALLNDGLRLNVSNFEQNYIIQARYRVGGNPTFSNWTNLTNGTFNGILTLPVVYPGDASFEIANTGNTPAGEAAWEIQVINTSSNAVIAQNSIIYEVITEEESIICDYIPTSGSVDLESSITPTNASAYLGDNITFNVSTINNSAFDVENVSNTVCVDNGLQIISASSVFQAITINGKSCAIFSFSTLSAVSTLNTDITAKIIQNSATPINISSTITFSDETKTEVNLVNNSSNAVITILSDSVVRIPDLVRTGGVGIGE